MNLELNHAAFEELLLARRLGVLPHGESEQLRAHLATCERCRRFEAAIEAGLTALAGQPVAAPAGLSRATRVRVRLRAAELAERDARLRLVVVAVALAGVSGLVSARVLWLGVDWFGRQSGLPFGALVCLFAVIWLAPATLGGLAVVWARARQARFSRAWEEMSS
jgi:hypothetical protein